VNQAQGGKEVLQEKRAAYGEQIVPTLAAQLLPEFGTGFADKNLRRMVQFAEAFPDQAIVVTLSRQLSWSHFVAIIPQPNDLQRDFYAEMCRLERWSGIRVASYLTDLPPGPLLQKKLHEAVRLATARLKAGPALGS
jgi:hypothetical protein